jgi:hypothetical protein
LGTLHRIQWPLQPWSRDRHTAFGDGPTARWHSHATLGLRPILTHSRSGIESGTPAYLSLASPVDGFTHRRSLRARSPFTRPCRPFWSAFAELIRDQTPPNDFCNCISTCGQLNLGPLFLAGTMASTIFLFLRFTSLFRAVRRGEPRSVRFDDPGAGSSRLREFTQPRYHR